MATNEKVNYSYELDISNLQKGTKKAITAMQKQIDCMVGLTNKTKSAEASAKVFEKEWLRASNKVTAAQEKMAQKVAQAQEKVMREVAKTQAYLDRKESSSKNKSYKSTGMQKQIEDLVGIHNKTKSAEASAKAFEKAWLNASDKVSAKTSKTSKNIEEVAQKTSLGATLARNALSKVSQLLGQMQGPVNKVIEPIKNKLNELAHTVDPNLVKKLQGLKSKAVQAFSKLSPLLSTVSSAFRRVSGDADKADGSTSRLTKSLTKLSSVSSRFSNFFAKASNALKNFNSNLKLTGAAGSLAQKAIKALTAERLAEFLSEGIHQSIAYVENLNLFTVAMGKAVDQGNEFVATMQELYGMDPSNIMRYAGNFFQLATAIEMPDEAATQLSLTMTKAVNDISSLFNVDIETVFENMSSGLQGMSRAVRKYGMDIRTTTLQTEALALGITDQVENMSEANRIGLRFIAMMKQASNAASDFAYNIETPANQFRILKEQVTQLGRAIGDFFIAPIRTALQYINGFVMAVRSLLIFIRTLLGLEVDFQTRTGDVSDGASDASDAISDIGSSADSTSKKLKNMLAPFDELNVLTKSTSGDTDFGSDIMDPRIADAVKNLEYQFEDVEMKANKVRNAILDFFGFTTDNGTILSWDSSQFEENLINKFPQWTKTIQAAFDNWSGIVESFKQLFGTLGDVFSQAWDKYKESLGNIFTDESGATFFENLTNSLNSFSKWLDEHSEGVSTFVMWMMKLLTVFVGLKIASPLITGISSAFGLLSKAFGLVSSVGTGVIKVLGALPQILGFITSPVGIIITAVVLLSTVSEDFRKSLGNLIETLLELLQTILEPIVKVVKVIVDKLLPPLIDLLSGLGDALAPVIDLLAEVLEFIMPFVNIILDSLSNIIVDFVSALSGIFQSIANFVKGIAQIIRGVVDIVAGILNGDFKRIGRGFIGILVGILNTITSIIDAVLNIIITAINSAISLIWNLLLGAINEILQGVQSILSWVGVDVDLHVNWSAPQIPKVSIPKIKTPGYEDGGFPEKGTYFRALENGFGSEMIGTVGGRTAVANNEQIEKGIARAVLDTLTQTGLINYIRSIDQNTRETADKDFTLGNPSATAGRWIKQSSDAYNKIRG